MDTKNHCKKCRWGVKNRYNHFYYCVILKHMIISPQDDCDVFAPKPIVMAVAQGAE